jgi:hypothetical protein
MRIVHSPLPPPPPLHNQPHQPQPPLLLPRPRVYNVAAVETTLTQILGLEVHPILMPEHL